MPECTIANMQLPPERKESVRRQRLSSSHRLRQGDRGESPESLPNGNIGYRSFNRRSRRSQTTRSDKLYRVNVVEEDLQQGRAMAMITMSGSMQKMLSNCHQRERSERLKVRPVRIVKAMVRV